MEDVLINHNPSPMQERDSTSTGQDPGDLVQSTDNTSERVNFSDDMRGKRGLPEPYNQIWIWLFDYLDFEDVVTLGLTCKRLYSLLKDENVCKVVLEVCS